ncbi:MAG: hypothetical protein OER95_16995 [Acidimicrobiia bacterium]|nr:hypothetical protein [Acidimicrobiia bacterium]
MSNERAPENLTDDPMAQLGSLVGAGIRWSAAMTNELQHLPTTLQQLRRGVENFEEATRVMASSAARFNDILDLYSRSLGQAAERSAGLARLMQRQVEALTETASPDVVRDVLGEVGRAVETMARLNPLWPAISGTGRGPDTESDNVDDRPGDHKTARTDKK